MQVITKLIEDNAVNDAKIRLRNNQFLKGRNNANTSDVNLWKIGTDDNLHAGAKPISSFTPSNPTDLATVQWVTEYMAGQRGLKEACDYATTGNISLVPAPFSIDGTPPAVGDRILVKDQTTGSENGIYIFDGTDLVRATDFDGSPASEVVQGVSVDVINGIANGRTRWILTNDTPTIGVTSLTFVQIPAGATSAVEQNEVLTLNSTDITNQYVDLANTVLHASVKVFFSGIKQRKTVDYTLSDVGLVTRITFDGDLATGGAIQLANGDVLDVDYEYEP